MCEINPHHRLRKPGGLSYHSFLNRTRCVRPKSILSGWFVHRHPPPQLPFVCEVHQRGLPTRFETPPRHRPCSTSFLSLVWSGRVCELINKASLRVLAGDIRGGETVKENRISPVNKPHLLSPQMDTIFDRQYSGRCRLACTWATSRWARTRTGTRSSTPTPTWYGMDGL